jgi:DNA-binding transcriptional MocR family regulator
MESPAYRVLSLAAHRAMSRIEIELRHHAGKDNGKLPVTFSDFVDYGIHHASVTPALRELEAVGIIRITRGRAGNAEHRSPNLFYLTFANGRDKKEPPHDWRKVETTEQAEELVREARAAKNPQAVERGRRQAGRRKTNPTTGFRKVSLPETGGNSEKSHYRKPVVQATAETGSTIDISGGDGCSTSKPWPTLTIVEMAYTAPLRQLYASEMECAA